MSQKTDTWVVVRFDSPAQEHSDFVAVKGVYDSEADAQAAAGRAAGSQQHSGESSYHVFHSRRFTGGDEQGATRQAAQRLRIQGLPTDHLQQFEAYWRYLPDYELLRSAAERLPSDVRRRVLQPLLAYYAEAAIARALGAKVVGQSQADADLRLPDGRTVQVKTIFLDPEKARAPFVQFRPDRVDYLALVLVTPDLELTTARLIPSDVLTHFDRPGPRTRDSKLTNLRVTTDLMSAPGTSNIDLRPAA
jgi:hypothetical protein